MSLSAWNGTLASQNCKKSYPVFRAAPSNPMFCLLWLAVCILTLICSSKEWSAQRGLGMLWIRVLWKEWDFLRAMESVQAVALSQTRGSKHHILIPGTLLPHNQLLQLITLLKKSIHVTVWDQIMWNMAWAARAWVETELSPVCCVFWSYPDSLSFQWVPNFPMIR